MRFNVNNYFRVKLTPEGEAILKQAHDEIQPLLPESARKEFELRLTPDGWYRAQAWSIMQDFGPHIGIGMNSPFETEIEIED